MSWPISARPTVRLLSAGDRLRNTAYAAFLRRLAAQGPAAFYAGETAARIVERTRAGPLGGSMTLADLAAYRPIKREPLCRHFAAVPDLRPAAAIERGRPAAADGHAGADRYRRSRPCRSASLVPVRRGQPPDVRRPRPLTSAIRRLSASRSSGLLYPDLCHRAAQPHRNARRAAAVGRNPAGT